MNEANLVKRISELVTGDIFLAERELPQPSLARVAASGIPVGAATAPTAVVNGVSFANGETALLTFTVPQDYDSAQDKIALRLHQVPAADEAETTALGITTAQSIFRAGAAVNATASSAVSESATSSSGALVRENILNISGRGYQPGDTVRLTLSAVCSNAAEVILLGGDLIYGSSLRPYNNDDNERSL